MNGIDYKKLEFEFGEDWDIFRELLIDFQEALSNLLEQIKVAIDTINAESLKISAHTFKGIVVNFYCEELSKAAFFLEECGKNSDFSNANDGYDKLVIINSNILAELMDYDKKRM
jgi:HPt (histidine-containing phosphotransfer) domain-containing protein